MAVKDLAPPVRPKATLVYSPHPLLSEAGRVIRETVAIQGETLGDYLRRHGVDTTKPLVVTVDGRQVVRDEWELLDPEPGQLVAARAAVAGGDGSNALAFVAMIAVAVFAQWAAPILVNAMGGAATFGAGVGLMTHATAGVVTMAGSMLVNKMLPPPKMDLGRGLSAAQSSPSYSISGGQNRARPYEPLALVLGTHRVFFDLACRPYTTYEGEDQYLYQVFCIGLVGPHGSLDVSALRIGSTLLSSYEGVTTEMTVGTLPAMMPANVDTIAGAAIDAGSPQVIRTTSPDTTKIELDFTAMSFRARSSGKIEGALLDWTIEYCAAGTGAWQTLEYVSTNGNGQKPVRITRSYSVPAGQYDVRVTGHTLSTSSKFIRQLSLDAIKCYQPDNGYYEGQQFIGVKIKATGQLNGMIDRLNGIVRMPTAPGVYSNNPADLFRLFAIGHKGADGRALWGGQLSASALDVAGLDAFRAWCATKGLTFNAVVDQQRSVWDVLQAITRCGRGSPTWAPGKLGVVWDADNQPVVASFNMANIKRGTFEVAYQSEDPVEEVVLTYINAADDYAPDQVRAVAPGVTSPRKSATVELWGCTSQAMAVKECHLALAENLYRTRLVSWETDMEGLVVTRGDVVSLSHDLTQWGKSGRLVAGTTTVLQLDQAITLDSAGTWIGVISPDGTQYTCRVQYEAGEHSEITLLDPLPIAPDSDNPVDWRYTADYVATPGKLVKIVSIVPSGMDSVRLSAVDEYDEYYASENGSYTPPAKRPWLSNQPQIRGLGVHEEIVKSGGSYTTRLVITWTEIGAVASRLVRYSIDGGAIQTAGYADGPRFELMVPDAGSVLIIVTLYDGAGQTSSAAQASVSHNLAGLAYAPFELASLNAVGELFQIRLTWAFQGDINDVRHVEVWGGNLNNRASATLLTTQAAPSNGWLHTGLQAGQTWFYWARVVDSKGRTSDFLPLSATDGVAGTTSSNPSDILDVLTGSITEDQLYQDLSSRIDQIDAPTTGALAQISAVQSQVNALQAEVADLSGTEAYDPAVTYQAEDLVTYNGGLYRALQTTTGNLPTDATYWAKIGDYASLGEAVSGLSVAVDDLETRVTANESGLSSEVTARSTLATQIRGSYTGTNIASVTSGLIYSERQARTTADASEVTARQALAATITGYSDPNGKVLADLTSGLIFEEKTARVDAVSAVASQVTTLSAQVSNNTAAITAEQTARADADSSLSSSISTVSAVANAKNKTYRQNSAPTSGMAAGDLWFDADGNNKAHRYSGSAWVATDDTRIAANAAAITAEQTARADADSALASDITTLSTTVGGYTASIQANATAIDGIEAKYTVKIDNNGYVSGYGLISTANNGTPTSAFTVLADKFQVVTPGKTPKVPFVVGTVNGQSTVGIDGSLVVDGSIVANKIDTRGLTVKDAAGNVILSSGVPLDWARVGGANKPQNGATVGATWGSNISGQPSNDDLLNAGANLAPNPDLKTGNDTTAGGWGLYSKGALQYVLRLVDPNHGPGWDKNQPFFYTNASGSTAETRWWSDPIPVDAGKNYTVSAWARSLSGSGAPSYLGVMCLNDAGAELGYVYPPGLNSFSHTTTWAQRKGVFGPGHTAFISGTTKVRLVWWGTYQAAGANLATRFGFNEGVVPSRSVIPADAFPITSSNASTYIANAAIGQLQVDLASANRLIVGTANIGNAAVDTLQVAGNAITAPAISSIGGLAGYDQWVVNRVSEITLGTFSTNPNGRGTVTLFITPDVGVGAIATATSKATGSDTKKFSFVIQLRRNGAVVKERTYTMPSFALTGSLNVAWSVVHDSPGPGVYCHYTLYISSWETYAEYHNHSVPPLSIMFLETSR